MNKKIIKGFFSRMKERVSYVCNSLAERTRAMIIIAMGMILGSGSVFAIAHSIYILHKQNSKIRIPKIEHVKRLELISKDSINLLNYVDYDRTSEQKSRNSNSSTRE